jgi:hypothetical protein
MNPIFFRFVHVVFLKQYSNQLTSQFNQETESHPKKCMGHSLLTSHLNNHYMHRMPV